MGHCSLQSLGFASKVNFWEDAVMIEDPDPEYWDCQVTFSRKANRGKGSITPSSDVLPGECLMMDIQTNTSEFGITQSSHYGHFLQITDAAS